MGQTNAKGEIGEAMILPTFNVRDMASPYLSVMTCPSI